MSDRLPAGLADYRDLLRPDHPLVREIGAPSGTVDERVAEVLRRIRERFAFRSIPGLRSLDELYDAMRREPGSRPEVSCFTLCCVLGSCLRAAGVPARRFLVALGGSREFPHFHAWVLLRRSGRDWWCIAPESLTPRTTTGDRLLKSYRFHVLFNELELFFHEREKRDALLGRRIPEPQLVLYGSARPELVEAIEDRAFRDAVADLFAGRVLQPDERTAQRLERWSRWGLLRVDGGTYVPEERLLVVPADALDEFRRLAAPALEAYLQILEESARELRRRFSGTDAGRRHSWTELVHPMLGGLLMDLAVGRRLAQRGDALGHDGGAVVWAFEEAPSDNPYGVQWSAERESRTCFAQLWHARTPRQPPGLTAKAVAALGRAVRPEGLPSSSPEGLYLRYLGLLRRDAGTLEPTFPVIDPKSFSALSGTLDAAASELVDHAVAPALDRAGSIPWWCERVGHRGYRHALIRLILELAADAAVESGVLPPFPSAGTASPSWGRWLWSERAKSPSFIPAPPSEPLDSTRGSL